MRQPTTEDKRIAVGTANDWLDSMDQPREDLYAAIAQALANRTEACAALAQAHKPWRFKQNGPDPHYTSCEGCGEHIAGEIRSMGQ